MTGLRLFAPVVPFALGIALEIPAPSPPVRACVAATALLVALGAARCARGARPRTALSGVCLAVALFLAGGLAAQSERTECEMPLRALPPALRISAGEGRIVRLSGRFEDDPDRNEGRLNATVRAESLEDGGLRAPFPARVSVSWPALDPDRDAPPLLADRPMTALLRLRLPRNFGNPGAFDFVGYLRRRRILALATIKSPAMLEVHGSPSTWNPALAVRRRFDRILRRLYGLPGGELSPEGSVLRASILGGRFNLPARTERALVASGVYHILAISGLQVAIFGSALLLVLRRTPVPPRLGLALATSAMLFYGQVAAASPSVRRALVMGGLAAIARGLHRKTPPLALLALAAMAALAWRPSDLADPGFQLTFGASAGILLLAPRIRNRLDARWGLSEMLAASVSAHAATFPLVARWFHRVVPYGLASNLLAVPLGSAAVVLGICLLPADLISERLADMLGPVAGLAVRALLAVASVPVEGTVLSFRVAEPGTGALVAAGAGVVVLARARRGAFLALGGALLAGSFVLIVAGPPGCGRDGPLRVCADQARARDCGGTPVASDEPDGPLTVDAIDVGQGDAILVRFPDGESMLVDGGGFAGSTFDVGERVLVPALEHRGLRRLGRVVLTHAHEDHGGGLRELLRDLSVDELLSPAAPEGALRDELEDLARAQGARVLRIRRGYTIHEGQVAIECLGPMAGALLDPNADSLVLRLVHGERSILLTGDIDAASERKLVALGLPRTDILKVAHHGSAGSSGGAFLSALLPRAALISVGEANRFGHPSSEVVARLSGSGVRVLRTDRDGAARVALCGAALFAGSLREDSPQPFPGPALRPRSGFPAAPCASHWKSVGPEGGRNP